MFADLGAVGYGAQSIEIQVGPAVDGNQTPVALSTPLGVGFQSSKRQRSGGFGYRSHIVEDVLYRRAHGVGIHGDDLVKQFTAKAERLLPCLADGDTVGEQSDLIQSDNVTLGE